MRMLYTLTFSLFLTLACSATEETQRSVLCTTFPTFQITRNLTHGNARLKVQLLLPSQLGCPHDYALTPQDMARLSRAKILVINGLGLEAFLGGPLKQHGRGIHIIDASKGIQNLIHLEEEEEDHHEDHEHGHDDEEEAEAANPHLFASPRMAAQQALSIANQLSVQLPTHAARLKANATAYAKKLNRLADDFKALGARLRNRKIVQPHGAFDYLARDMGLTIVATL
ncbi:MAG: metal ABC transporter substrate-binding protein, partial [Planctomycetota bacterium]